MAEDDKVSEPLLEVRNLSKNFGAVQALQDLSMSVAPGEVVALAGDNGAGKTTLIKAISGVYKPSGGDILLRGQKVEFSSARKRPAKRGSRRSIRIWRWPITCPSGRTSSSGESRCGGPSGSCR
jgi:ABC-type branched-subunit amino acid transport system ATPase component